MGMIRLAGLAVISMCLLLAFRTAHAAPLNIDQKAADSAVAELIGLALQGAGNELAGGNVQFKDEQTRSEIAETIQTGNFQLASTLNWHRPDHGKDSQGRSIGGVLLHQDGFGRCVSTRFDAVYYRSPNGLIQVSETALASLAPPLPSTGVYIVPAEKVTPSILNARPSVLLMDYIAKNAVARIRTSKNDRMARNYYLFAFVMHRLAEDSRIDLVVSDMMSGFGGNGKNARAVQDRGWYMAYMPIKTGLGRSEQLYFKVIYTAGSNTPGADPKPAVIGVYTTDSMVQQTQRILAARGYRPGPADGIMGRRTRNAIKAYQRDIGLKANGRLSPVLYSTFVVNSPRRPQPLTPTPQTPQSNAKPKLDRLKPKMWQNMIQN